MYYRSFPMKPARALVFAQAFKLGMAEMMVRCPLDQPKLPDQHRLQPTAFGGLTIDPGPVRKVLERLRDRGVAERGVPIVTRSKKNLLCGLSAIYGQLSTSRRLDTILRTADQF